MAAELHLLVPVIPTTEKGRRITPTTPPWMTGLTPTSVCPRCLLLGLPPEVLGLTVVEPDDAHPERWGCAACGLEAVSTDDAMRYVEGTTLTPGDVYERLQNRAWKGLPVPAQMFAKAIGTYVAATQHPLMPMAAVGREITSHLALSHRMSWPSPLAQLDPIDLVGAVLLAIEAAGGAKVVPLRSSTAPQ